MPVLYIVCGPPFSGKTMLARHVADTAGATLVSYDALWAQMMAETGRSWGFGELCALAEARIAAALRSGVSAVYDTLNNSRGWRDRLGDLATRNGARPVVVYLDTPLAVIEARRAENDLTLHRHAVSAETLREEIAKFEAPRPPEPVAAFTPGTDLAAWLRALVDGRAGLASPYDGRGD